MKNKWSMFFILLLSSITVGISQLKIAAVLGLVSEYLKVSIPQAAWLMALFTVAGIVLAIPGAAIMTKTGPKKLLLGLMASLALGNVMGALSGNFAVMMASRVVEGISYAMIIMVGIAMISTWFADGGANTAIGIFNTFAAIANFVAMSVSIPMVTAFGLKSLWWGTALLAGACFVLVLMFVTMPAPSSQESNGHAGQKVTMGEALKNGRILVLAAAQLCIAFVLFSFITTYPQLFTGFYGLTPEKANFYASLNGLFGIPFCILCGLLIEKTGRPFAVAIFGSIGMIALCFTVPLLGPSTYVIHVLASAIFPGGLVLTAVFCIAPQITKRPELIGYSMSFINLLYFLGVFFCTPMVMGAVAKSGWPAAANIMTAFAVAATILLMIAASMGKKRIV